MINFKFVIVLLCLCIGTNVNGQFIKKLKERTKEAVEETIARKSAEKAADETGKAIDKIFYPDGDKNQSENQTEENSDRAYNQEARVRSPSIFGSKVDPIHKTNKYNYEWKYTLKIVNTKQDMEMQYYLVNDGTDFAAKYKMGKSNEMIDGMISIMDQENKISVSLFEMNGQKSGSIMTMNFEKMAESDEEYGDYVMKELGTKTIMGYPCQGYQMENDEHTIISYIALDAPVSFTPNFGNGTKQKNMPAGIDPKIFEKIGDDSLMMEMEFISKKKDKENFKMVCTELKKEKLDIDLSDYHFMF